MLFLNYWFENLVGMFLFKIEIELILKLIIYVNLKRMLKFCWCVFFFLRGYVNWVLEIIMLGLNFLIISSFMFY